jgi:hypothetical protein
MSKKMKNNHKLYVFLSMFKKHIYLELVQNRWVVISSVKMFILSMYNFFVEVKLSYINIKHRHFGLVFQQAIKLRSQEPMFPFNRGAYLTLDLLHFTLFIKHRICPWYMSWARTTTRIKNKN